MSVSICIYIYVFIHVYICVYINNSINILIYVCMYMDTCIHIYTYAYIYQVLIRMVSISPLYATVISTCVYIHASIFIYVDICTHVHIHMYTYVYTRMYIDFRYEMLRCISPLYARTRSHCDCCVCVHTRIRIHICWYTYICTYTYICISIYWAITVAYRGLIRNISYRKSICMHIDVRYEMLRCISPLYATVIAACVYIHIHMGWLRWVGSIKL